MREGRVLTVAIGGRLALMLTGGEGVQIMGGVGVGVDVVRCTIDTMDLRMIGIGPHEALDMGGIAGIVMFNFLLDNVDDEYLFNCLMFFFCFTQSVSCQKMKLYY